MLLLWLLNANPAFTLFRELFDDGELRRASAYPEVLGGLGRLDEIPDAELDRLARWGINGLWLIGLWERSPASRRIKQLTGNPEAASSASAISTGRCPRSSGARRWPGWPRRHQARCCWPRPSG